MAAKAVTRPLGAFAADTARDQRLTPETFHILVFHVLDSRRIFVDGRDFRPMWTHLSSGLP